MGVFFMSVGMGIDLREVARNHVWIVLSVIGLLTIKATVLTGIFRVGGRSWGSRSKAACYCRKG